MSDSIFSAGRRAADRIKAARRLPIPEAVQRDAAPDSCTAQLAVEEAARLALLWRLAAGAAHGLNNALTAILGEASFLADDHKDDPRVVEGCDAIAAEVDRCARMTRALLARRQPAQGRRAEVDLVRLVGDLGRLLHETLGRRIELEVTSPDDLLVVAGDAAALELLCLALVHFAADLQPGGARLRLGVEPGPGATEVSLSVSVHAEDLPVGAARRVLEPGAGGSPLEGVILEAARRAAAAHGARIESREAPGWLEVRVRFPALDAE